MCISILSAKEKIGSVLHAAAFLLPCSLLFLLTGKAVDLFASHFSMHCVSSWDNILIALSTMHSTMHNRFSPHVIFLDSAATHSKEVQGCLRTDPHSYETTRIKGPPSAWGLASERDEIRNRNVTQLWFCHLKSWNETMLNVSWQKALFFSDTKSRLPPPPSAHAAQNQKEANASNCRQEVFEARAFPGNDLPERLSSKRWRVILALDSPRLEHRNALCITQTDATASGDVE